MRQFVGAVVRGEQHVVAVRLSVLLERTVREIDQDGEVRKRAGDLGVVDGNGDAVTPARVIPCDSVESDARCLGDRDSVGRVRCRVGGRFAGRILDGESDHPAGVRAAAGG